MPGDFIVSFKGNKRNFGEASSPDPAIELS